MPYMEHAELTDSPPGTQWRTPRPSLLPYKVCDPHRSPYASEEAAAKLDKKTRAGLRMQPKRREVRLSVSHSAFEFVDKMLMQYAL